MRIEIDDISRPQVLALLEEHLRNMREITPAGQVFALDANKLRAPGLVFWTAWKDEMLLGCVALYELSSTAGEVKSMRTPASLRRRGVGRALLEHILQVCRQRGYRELFLETGSHPAFAPAQALYRSVGFRECGPFGAYKENGFSVFMSLRLGGEPRLVGVEGGTMGRQWLPHGFHTVTPNIIVDDAEAAIAFFKRALGATERYRLMLSNGRITHCELSLGDSVINVGESQEGWPAHSLVAQIFVEDSDSLFERAVSAGATVVMPMTDMFFGSREGRVLDPFGNIWTIATLKEHVSPEEMQRRMSAAGY
jgi:putative acetyltransferase